ncbi:hypothetical protein XF_0344 [Xylella fastidiosa 9a5c]|uniref:Uncharacterized protein n=1 Tax=Xylella fastidiosa (strain 9a5c) TaxID=160492 RepID=Q9PGF8_XYLFA|nr:hypothetical protein XF_0344 [Xylella fastidiosa 9a5c]
MIDIQLIHIMNLGETIEEQVKYWGRIWIYMLYDC